MAEKVITLFFDDNSIKMLIVKNKKAEQWASIALEPGLIVAGVVSDEIQVANKVRELMGNVKSSKIKRFLGRKDKIIVGMSGRDSLYRVLSLPVLADALLHEAVRREAARVLPVSLDDLYLSYQRIPSNDDETRIFIAAYQKTATDSLLETLKMAGVKPNMLDLAPLALCLSINEPKAIIADVRQDNLNIIVMADRVPQVIRSIVLQSEDKTVEDNLPSLSEEFSRTVAFYNSGHQQEPLDENTPVFVSGDLVKSPDSWQTLVSRLNANVAVLPSVIEYPEDFPVSDFIINLGLATKDLGLEKDPENNYCLVNLNALPEAGLGKAVNFYRIIVPVVAVAGIALIVFLWMGWQDDKENTELLQSQLADAQNQVTANNKAIATLTEQNRITQAKIQPILDAANIFSDKMNVLEAERILTDSDVHQIVALRPETVDINSVNYSATDKSINGFSKSEAEILNYAQALRDTVGFEVVVSTIAYAGDVSETGALLPRYNFTFQMK